MNNLVKNLQGLPESKTKEAFLTLACARGFVISTQLEQLPDSTGSAPSAPESKHCFHLMNF